jgi:hypothetical protein
MIRLFAIILCLMASPALAYEGQIAPGHVWGNPTAVQTSGRDSSPSGILGRKGVFFVDDYTTYADFVHDDKPAFTAAIAAAVANGGGTVYISPKTYWSNTGTINVPKTVSLRCSTYSGKLVPSTLDTSYDSAAVPCSVYFTMTPGSIAFTGNGEISDINIFNDIVHFIGVGTTRANMRAFITSFTGTGVKIGDGTSSRVGQDAILRNVMMGGFDQCITVDRAQQVVIQDILGDCTSGLNVIQAFDDNRGRNIEFWPFLIANKTHRNDAWVISALADNGVGLWRATLATPSDVATGEQLWIDTGTGGEGATGLWTVTAIDATHVDLQGSASAPATTGNPTINSNYIAVASTANLQPGMNISGVGIPAGATVAAVWRTRNAISIDQNHMVTASGTGVALTFSSNAYTTGSSLTYDGTYRTGTGFALGQADGMTCEGCFAYGHLIGFNFNHAVGLSLTNTQYDAFSHIANQNAVPIGIEFTGTTTYGNYVSGSLNTSGGVHVLSNCTNTAGSYNNIVDGFRPGGGQNISTVAEIASGGLTMSKFIDGGSHRILVSAVAQTPVFTGNALANTTLYGTTTAPSWNGSNLFSGNDDQLYPLTVGARHVVAALPTQPLFQLVSGLSPADQKLWEITSTSTTGSFFLRTSTDAGVAGSNAMVFARGTGTAITSAQINTAAGVQAFKCDATQHCQSGNATAPTIASGACGATTNGAVVAGSNDQSMEITIGAAATTSCAITFAGTWASAPRSCSLTPSNAAAAAWGTTGAYISGHTTTTLTITGSALANANYGILCF